MPRIPEVEKSKLQAFEFRNYYQMKDPFQATRIMKPKNFEGKDKSHTPQFHISLTKFHIFNKLQFDIVQPHQHLVTIFYTKFHKTARHELHFESTVDFLKQC